MRLLFFCAAVIALPANAAVAADWRLSGFSGRGASLIDASSVRQLGPNRKSAWVATVWSRTDANGVDYMLKRVEFDCQQETSTNVSFLTFRADGSNINGEHTREPPEYHAPGSFGEDTLRRVCAVSFRRQNWLDLPTFLRAYRSPDFAPIP